MAYSASKVDDAADALAEAAGWMRSTIDAMPKGAARSNGKTLLRRLATYKRVRDER